MKKGDIKDLTMVELAGKSRDLRLELFNLQMQKATSQLEKPAQLRVIRRNIARVETRISALRNTAK